MQAIDRSKVVLVTGASGSIGLEIATLAAEGGWAIGVHGRTAESAERATHALAERVSDARLLPLGGDLLVAGTSQLMIDTIEREFGRLDAVVNSAVSAPPGILGAFASTDPRHYTDLCHHAVTQLQWLCHAAFPLEAVSERIRNGGRSSFDMIPRGCDTNLGNHHVEPDRPCAS